MISAAFPGLWKVKLVRAIVKKKKKKKSISFLAVFQNQSLPTLQVLLFRWVIIKSCGFSHSCFHSVKLSRQKGNKKQVQLAAGYNLVSESGWTIAIYRRTSRGGGTSSQWKTSYSVTQISCLIACDFKPHKTRRLCSIWSIFINVFTQ